MTMKYRAALCALGLAGLAATVPAAAQEVVKIGFSGPLSGGAAQYGKNTLDGLKFAVDELNAENFQVGGKKVTFEVVALDDKYNPSETAINFQRLVQQSKTPVVMCPHSGGGFAIQTSNTRLNTLLLSYTSVPKITAMGNKLTMRIPPDFSAYVKPFVAYEMKRYGKNLAIAGADHEYLRAQQPLLAGPAHLLEHDVPGVALDLLVGEVHARLVGAAGRRASAAPIGERRVEAVTIGDRPGHLMVGVVEPLGLRDHGRLAGRDAQGMAAYGHVAAALARDRLDLGVDDVRDGQAALLALGLVVDSDARDAKHIADE